MNLAQPLYATAMVAFELNNYEEAENAFRKRLRILEKNLGAEHPDLAGVLTEMAHFFKRMGKEYEARQFAERAQAIHRTVH
jgi:hypothetical protein